ncbi:MAG: GntP family permease [Planctomycetota bacterium]|jgi:GntP family gluconate:H+ symporter|nr:GntP family permease [Planctomycetota bacterium]
MVSGSVAVILLILVVAALIVATGKFKINAFLVLLFVAFLYGILIGMPIGDVVANIKAGFGGTLSSIGIVIITGTMMGVILEKTGAALVMTRTILGLVGKDRSPLAMNIAGFVVSIPVFCDSGYVILTPLNKALAKESAKSMAVMAVALATGLYATHTMVPPTPGPIAAASSVGADLGTVIIYGLIASIPASLIGYLWAVKVAARYDIEPESIESYSTLMEKYGQLPSVFASFLPLVLPLVLILFKSIIDLKGKDGTLTFGAGPVQSFISNIGDPVIALIIGVICALCIVPRTSLSAAVDGWLGQGIRDAAIVLAITGAGGSFGKILQGSPMVDYIKDNLSTSSLGIFLPFIISAAIKTAQGSSTVAIITTATIMAPMLGALGLNPALSVIAIGAGSMVVSHANDSYFWVVSQFSAMPVNIAYKVYTTATAVEGVTAMIAVYILALIF